jgi:threonine dehydratase
MPTLPHQASSEKIWTPPENLTGGFDLDPRLLPGASVDNALDPEVEAQLDAYPGNSDQDKAIRASILEEEARRGPVEKATRRIGSFLSCAAGIELNEELSELYGAEVYFAREDLQPTKSFKIRGAMNAIYSRDATSHKQGYVAASAGSHGLAVAFAARSVGAHARVFVPEDTPKPNMNGMLDLGAEVTRVQGSVENALEACMQHVEENPYLNFIHPYNDPLVAYGQGSAVFEALGKEPGFTKIVVPSGGGGLAAGTATAIAERGSNAALYTAEPEHAASTHEALVHGYRRRLRPELIHTQAEKAAVAQIGSLPYNILNASPVPVRPQVVSERSLIRATLWANEKVGRIECTAALGLAALEGFKNDLTSQDKVLVVLTGGNMADEKLDSLQRIAESEERATAHRLTMVS